MIIESSLHIAFVTMPFGLCAIPPIGISTLKAILNPSGLSSRVFNFNIEYLPWIGADPDRAWRLHDEIAYLWDFLPGEWLFSPSVGADEAYLSDLMNESNVTPEMCQQLVRLRTISDDFIAFCGERLIEARPKMIGFTTSFMQTQASMAVARYVKAHAPDIKVIVGGSNTFGEMGPALLEQFPEIDVVTLGEADALIEPLVRALAAGDSSELRSIRGIAYREDGAVRINPAADKPISMDSLPYPDYDDYFDTLEALRADGYPLSLLPLYLSIETSRGCWWGAKSHCSFCGLNGDHIGYRSKSPQRAIDEFFALAEKYKMSNFFAVDNILPPTYHETLMPALAAHPRDFFLHYEIKANLNRAQVKAMNDAGIKKVQPGIESLSTPVLKRMRKGISALRNIQALKWLTEFELQTSWFILHDIPGETVEEYEQTADTILKLFHLQAPGNLAPVYIERFSPLQVNPDEFGITILGPTRWYRHAFPDTPADRLAQLAYRFDHIDDHRNTKVDDVINNRVRPLVKSWKEHSMQQGCTLMFAVSGPDSFLIVGPIAEPQKIVWLPALYGHLLKAADAVISRNKLAISAENEVKIPPESDLPAADFHYYLSCFEDRMVDHRNEGAQDVESAIDQLLQHGLLLAEASDVLALPVPVTRSRLSATIESLRSTAGEGVLHV